MYEKMEKEILFSDVPQGWALCFNQQCEKKNCCLRQLAGAKAPHTVQQAVCVTPAAWADGMCSQFVEATPVSLARGFDRAFLCLHSRDARHELRLALTEYFGSRGSYYRHKHGERLLTPDRQQTVESLFRRYGYQQPEVFDEHILDYCYE